MYANHWLRRRAPVVLFATALAVVVFLGGIQVGRNKAFPYKLLKSAKITAENLFAVHWSSDVPPWLREATSVDLPPDRLESARTVLRSSSGMADRVVVAGGIGQFAEFCPGHPGCIAVEYIGPGQVAHAYPYRPREIEMAATVELPYEFSGDFDGKMMERGFGYVAALDTYPNGDLLVVFHFRHAFPYAGGVARIRPDGSPAWYRRDYSHHEPQITADGGAAWVPGLEIGQGPLRVDYDAPKQQLDFELPCDKPLVSSIRKIGPDGRVLEEIPFFDKLAASRYRFLLRDTGDTPRPCDPIHVNSVYELGPDATGPSGIRAGDLVVSMRRLNAFVLLDRDSFEVKLLVRGTFNAQHSVQHLTGSQFLVFDNWGVEADRDGPSRVLTVDVADGSETTVFPRSLPPPADDLFSIRQGSVSISPDRQRLIAAFANQSLKAFEIEIATGRVLTEFTRMHDLTPLGDFPGEARIVGLWAPGPYYVLDP